MILAEVLIERSANALNRPFTYLYPFKDKLNIGVRVVVSFANKDVVGYVTNVREDKRNKEEYEKALAWTKEHCKEGRDDNPEFVDFLGEKRAIKFTPEQKEKQWEFTIKMYCIVKDLIHIKLG